ncbi:MAG: hypothetical protein AAFP99_08780 [Pseudomonadota bacterium]
MVDYRDDLTQRSNDEFYNRTNGGSMAGPFFALLVVLAIFGGIFMIAGSGGGDAPTAAPGALETTPPAPTAVEPVPVPAPTGQ